jgi:hypothetical protein
MLLLSTAPASRRTYNKNCQTVPGSSIVQTVNKHKAQPAIIKPTMTYVLVKRFGVFQWRWPGKSSGAFAFFLTFCNFFVKKKVKKENHYRVWQNTSTMKNQSLFP